MEPSSSGQDPPLAKLTDDDVADAVLDPVPVTASVPVHAALGVVAVAFHAPPDAVKLEIVLEPEHPPPHTPVRSDGAATVYPPLIPIEELTRPPVATVNESVGVDGATAVPPPRCGGKASRRWMPTPMTMRTSTAETCQNLLKLWTHLGDATVEPDPTAAGIGGRKGRKI